MITTVFFDLDGTLLPMDQDHFIKMYLDAMAKKMMPYGYDPRLLMKSIWAGTEAMVRNNGSRINEEVFWESCSAVYGKDVRADEPLFQEFYQKEFQAMKDLCGYDVRAAQTIRRLKDHGYRVVLATNPLFPAIATHSRVRWTGLEPQDFKWITTYDNSSFCKPNLRYYEEILSKCGLHPEECVMVGNDVAEDMVAAKLGMKVFLLTDCLINKPGADIHQFPHGSFPELMEFIRGL
jgi:FMN phosphatase YigB (HAD superfamily)